MSKSIEDTSLEIDTDESHEYISQPVCLQSKNLNYFVETTSKKCCSKNKHKSQKQILHNVNVIIPQGKLVAILGPSGSGKTTLLDILSGRLKENVTGDVLINGVPIDKQIRQISGYVKQKDILLTTATVKETLTYSALLRLPRNLPLQDKLKRVDEIIAELSLKNCAFTQLGSDLKRGVSGGELKRTAIGVELITNPYLLFLDEPTSGLDASAALQIVKSLRKLADKGCTVVSTIHQPRPTIWSLFDKVILMAEGRVVFSGTPTNSLKFFGENGHHCPKYFNPADYVMDVLAGSFPSEEKLEDASSVLTMTEKFKESKYAKRSNKVKIPPPVDFEKNEHKKPNAWDQFKVLFIRSWKNNLRNPLILYAQLAQHIFLALFCGLMYLQIGAKPGALFDRIASIFFVLLNITWVPVLTTAFVFPMERPIFNRERASGHYGTLAYYLASTISDFPLQLLFVLFNATVSYWMLGLRQEFGNFVIFVAIILLCLVCLQGAALVFSAVSPTADVANLIIGILLLLFLSFAGFFLTISNIPVFFRPIEYISPFKYALRALLQNDLKGLNLTCVPTPVPCPLEYTGNLTMCTAPCLIPNGDTALASYGFADSNIGLDVIALAVMTIIYRVIVYILLLFVKVGLD